MLDVFSHNYQYANVVMRSKKMPHKFKHFFPPMNSLIQILVVAILCVEMDAKSRRNQTEANLLTVTARKGRNQRKVANPSQKNSDLLNMKQRKEETRQSVCCAKSPPS